MEKIVASILYRYVFKENYTTNDVECWNRLLPKTYVKDCVTAINEWNQDDIKRTKDAKYHYDRYLNPFSANINGVIEERVLISEESSVVVLEEQPNDEFEVVIARFGLDDLL